MTRRPEILAPAGDRDALAAALAAGADAVYLGLDDGFNARARAVNFPSDALAEVVTSVHRAGARVYVTVNTLVFEPELPIVEQLLRRIAAAGVDAIIVQDPAVARIARALCPELEIHASTQMTLSSPEAVGLLADLGLSRVVVPRELSVDEIRTYAASSPVPLEVFIHGALCVAWSGQCLSSEVWGGRSANRGQCAQACRLPYQLVVDGSARDLGDVEYLLSPKDLVGLDAVPALADIGVASLKIEGRLKGPAYVATTVARYRDAVARAVGEPSPEPAVEVPIDDASLHVAYSRGISAGFLGGADHQTLVEGRFPRHPGLPLGRVVGVDGDIVTIIRDADQRPITGGLAIGSKSRSASTFGARPAISETTSDASTMSGARVSASNDARPVAGARTSGSDAATSVAGVRTSESHATSMTGARTSESADATSVAGAAASMTGARTSGSADATSVVGARTSDAGTVAHGLSPIDRVEIVPRPGMGIVFDASRPDQDETGGPIFGVDPIPGGYRLRFGTPGPDLTRVSIGDFVWASSDPRVTRAGERAAEAGRQPLRRIPVDVVVTGHEGVPLAVTAIARSRGRGFEARAETTSLLAAARGAGLSGEVLGDKLGGFGGTPFHLGTLDAGGLAGGLHVPVSELKELRRRLVVELDAAITRVDRTIAPSSVLAALGSSPPPIDHAPEVVPLCRNDAQLDAVLDAGADEVELDWMELVGLARAVARARERGARVVVATTRVQKPGEHKIDHHLARLLPDAALVRSWGSLAVLSREGLALHGDFSLNITNSISAAWVLARGLHTITAAHDLDRDQLLALLDATPRGRVAVTVHHHVPTFHTEHCVYAHLLSTGRDFTTCGRPCERHAVALRDRVGMVHPVVVDVGCRNTVFNAQAQSAASLVPDLIARGVWRFRIELVRETAGETRRLFEAYRGLVAGTLSPAEVVRSAAVHEQFGVTRGTMRTLTVLA